MGNTPPNTTLNPENAAQTILEFPDNLLMIDLCGEFDSHLTQLEKLLNVQVVRRGNQLVVAGEPESLEWGVGVIQGLYQRLETGRPVDKTVIEAAIRLGQGTDENDVAADQMEMFKGAAIEIKTRKKTIEPRTLAQKKYAQALFNNELVFGIGPAGTGKTYIAVAAAVNLFMSGEVERIVLSRPAVEAGERLGFLPGDMKDKVDPYMQPLYDALNDFLPGKQLAKLIEEKRIEIAPLAFMRGRTLSNAFVVLDEAQNATAMQMKMFLTRLGKGSRMAITGDRSQVDLPRGATSGLADAERLLKTIPKISFNYFTSKDVVRHPLVAKIIEAYDADGPIG